MYFSTAIMKQIDTLEDRLGITLFIRTNQGLVLTHAWEVIFNDAKYLVDYSNRSILKAKEIEKLENQQTIRIGTFLME